MFKTFAGFSGRFRWLILIVWTIAAVSAFLFAPKLSEVGINDDSQFLPADTESTQARDIIKNQLTTIAVCRCGGYIGPQWTEIIVEYYLAIAFIIVLDFSINRNSGGQTPIVAYGVQLAIC